jgi:hypothetical protein
VVSKVARVCPALTLSPTATATDFTVPETENWAVSLVEALTVPDDSTVCVMLPSSTVAS